MSSSLSPAAQAVKHAAVKAYWLFHSGQTAAALRAAADQVGEWESAEELRAIAAELEATHD